MKVGDRVYILLHAYHHLVGEVAEVLGYRSVRLTNVAWIYSCQRDWTAFFRDGPGNDTVYHSWPDGEVHDYLAAFDWKHPLFPRKEETGNAPARRQR